MSWVELVTTKLLDSPHSHIRVYTLSPHFCLIVECDSVVTTNYVILHLRCFARAAPYIVVYRQRPHLLFVTSQGPEAGQKQEKNGPSRHFASSYSTRARDLAKDIALGNSRGQTVHVIFI